MGNRSSEAARGWGLGSGGRRLGTQRPPSPQRALLRSVTLAALAVFAFTVVANAQPSDRARAEALARRATERLQALQREADRLAAQESTLLNDLRKLEIERQL